MNFENKLISGLFIKRYKRFFVDIKFNSQIITAHCPNTGSMYGLLKNGNKVWISKSNNPNRKLEYTLEIIQDKSSKVGVNTHFANKIVMHGLKNNLIKEFKNISEIKPEIKFGKNTRFDFLVSDKKNKIFIEVKSVTLSRKKGVAEFPDSVTSRGLKHINELVKAGRKNYKIFILYLVQRDDCETFAIAKDIDPNYAIALNKAIKSNLNVICYDCKFSPKGIKVNKQIKISIDE